jgi:hypothetical protein
MKANSCPLAPVGVLEGSRADVSFVAANPLRSDLYNISR